MPDSEIWKFPLTAPVTTLEIPGPVEFLSVGVQTLAGTRSEQAFVWARVTPNGDIGTWRLGVLMTGQPFDHRTMGRFLGTVQVDGIVGHVFEALGDA